MKAPYEREAMASPKNSAAILQQAIRRRLRTAKQMVVSMVRGIALVTVVGLTGLSGTSNADLTPEWISRVPVGNSLSGTAGIYVDPDGVSYITGTSGASPNTDITTVSFAPDGSTRWTRTWSSQGSGADIASGITKGSNGILYGTRTLTAPTISALSVTTLAQAGRLKISGSSFGAEQGSGIVTIGGATAPVSNWTDASITAYVPDSSPLGSQPVQVVTSSSR